MWRPCAFLGSFDESDTIEVANKIRRCSSWFAREAFVFMRNRRARADPERQLVSWSMGQLVIWSFGSLVL